MIQPETLQNLLTTEGTVVSGQTTARSDRPNRRTSRWPGQPLDCISHPSFEDPALVAEILGPMPQAREYEAKRRELKVPKGAPPELAPLYEMPLLSRQQEQHLFRKMNYLKYRAAALAQANQVAESEQLLTEAKQVKEMLINANMRLVVNIARRYAGQADNFFELLSDGNLSLMRAVEKFDYSRNFKFSTYASWAIIRNFSRGIPGEKQRREHFVTGQEEIFAVAPDYRSVEHDVLATQERASHGVNRLLQYLEPREREIIRMRAGLDDRPRAMTLEEIGQQFGISKERARQLNARAMKKLRSLAEEHRLEMQ